MPLHSVTSERLTPYQRRLFLFLSVATFFEGYDFMALTQLLPNIQQDLGLDEADAGLLVAFINLGTVVAYILVRKADRWGRRRVLTVTIAGYTTFTFLSGLAPNVWVFGLAQMLARIFLIGEWAISMVIAAEEFPAHKRGMVLGIIQAFSSFGAIACAGLVPLLLKAPTGWRTTYFAGVVPLLILAWARRGLQESRRFAEQVAADEREQREPQPLLHIFRTPYRKRVLQLGLIWLLMYVASHNAVTFWKEFAVHERDLSDGQVGTAITVAAVGAMPLVFYVGRLIDQVGRRVGAAIVFGLGSLGIVLSYTLHGQWALTGALVFGIFGASAMLPVLNAYTTELFPTALRGAAFAWANNLLGRIGYVVSPAFVGLAAGRVGWGPAVSATAAFPIVAVVLIFWLLPETSGRELEDTSAVGAPGPSAEGAPAPQAERAD